MTSFNGNTSNLHLTLSTFLKCFCTKLEWKHGKCEGRNINQTFSFQTLSSVNVRQFCARLLEPIIEPIFSVNIYLHTSESRYI